MKFIILFIILFSSAFAKTVDVDIKAQTFHSDEAKNIVYFKGNVSMIKAKDTLFCDEITIKTKRDPKTHNLDIVSYVAKGKVKFTFESKDGFFIGRGDKVSFNLNKELYIITGNGYLEDKINKKIIHGENIYFDGKSGYTKINGTKNKPVKFKFTIESK